MRARPGGPLARAPELSTRAAFAVITTVTVAVFLGYRHSLAVPFFFDDHAAITHNPTLRSLGRPDQILRPPADGGGVTGRPVVNLSLALNYALGGLDPRGYHLANLVLHALSTFVVFDLIRRTLRRVAWPQPSVALSAGIALFWSLHPLLTESVTCVIQRTELLVGLFYLLTLYGFDRSVETHGHPAWSVFAVACCALGMASKEVMVSAPIVVLLYDRTFVAGTFRESWRRHRRTHLALAATWLVLVMLVVAMGGSRGRAAGFGLGISAGQYALKQSEAIVHYLTLSAWPHPLVVDYGTDVSVNLARVILAIASIAILVLVTVVALRRRSSLGFLLFAFFAVLAPSSSVVPLVTQTMAEHRMYLPLLVVVAVFAIAMHRMIGRRSLIVMAAIAPALALSTAARNRLMQDEIALWTETIADVPGNARAHGCLGLALLDRGRAAEAIPHFERALALEPTSVATLQNVGNACFQLARYADAAVHFERVVALDPTLVSGYNNLATARLELGDTAEALRVSTIALRLDQNHVGAQRTAARAEFRLGHFDVAAVHYEAVARLRPGSPESHYDLGLALARAGQIERALPHFATALRLQPSPAAYVNYARFLISVDRATDAKVALEQALRMQPDFADARSELARLTARLP